MYRSGHGRKGQEKALNQRNWSQLCESQNHGHAAHGDLSSHDEGKASCQFGTPPIAEYIEMGTVVRFARWAMSGISAGYTVLIALWLAPMEPCLHGMWEESITA